MNKNVKTILENYNVEGKSYDLETLNKFVGKHIIVSVLGDYMYIENGILKSVENNRLILENMIIEYNKIYDLIIKNNDLSEKQQIQRLQKSEEVSYDEINCDLIKSLEGKFISYFEFNDNSIVDGIGKLVNVDEESITIRLYDNYDLIDLVEYDKELVFSDTTNLESNIVVYNHNQIKGVRELKVNKILDIIDISYMFQNCEITLYSGTIIYAYVISINIYNVEYKFVGKTDEIGNEYIGSVLTSDIKNIKLLK